MENTPRVADLTARLDRLKNRVSTPEECLQFFDSLEPASIEFMKGIWTGYDIDTGHVLNGFLKAADWYGKDFSDPENVDPLLFLDNENNLFKAFPNPLSMWLAPQWPMVKDPIFKPFLDIWVRLHKTDYSQARLRMMECRGKVSAAMIYDYNPINDVFRKVDEDTVFGFVDHKQVPKPMFFVMERDK